MKPKYIVLEARKVQKQSPVSDVFAIGKMQEGASQKRNFKSLFSGIIVQAIVSSPVLRSFIGEISTQLGHVNRDELVTWFNIFVKKTATIALITVQSPALYKLPQ